MSEQVKIVITGQVPVELMQAWLQHLRDFDITHPGCHFQVMADAEPSGISVRRAIELLQLNPGLTFGAIINREPK